MDFPKKKKKKVNHEELVTEKNKAGSTVDFKRQEIHTHGDGLLETLSGVLDQAETVGINIADGDGLVQISVEAILVHSHIQVDNISVLEGAHVGNSVANDLVDGCAA